MGFSWENSAKWGAFTGFGFIILNTVGDYMLIGNSIYKDFLTITFYKKLVSTILFFSLGYILFDWIVSLFVKRYFNKKNL